MRRALEPARERAQKLFRTAPVVEAPFAFLHEEREMLARHAVVAAQAAPRLAPEVVDGVDRAVARRFLALQPQARDRKRGAPARPGLQDERVGAPVYARRCGDDPAVLAEDRQQRRTGGGFLRRRLRP